MKKKVLQLGILLALMVAAGSVWGQQVIGSFPFMNGGFEGQSAGALGTTLSPTLWSRQNQSGASSSIVTTSPRSGPNYATVTSASSVSRNLQSPQDATASNGPAASTNYVVQFFVRNSSSVASFQGGVTTNGTSNPAYSTAATLAANANWTIQTFTLTTTSTTVSTCGIGIAGRAGAGSFDVDDFVIYPGTSADVSAPNSPGAVTVSNPTTSSLDVSWGAASGGVDGGGYVVVRYAVSPNANNDPNQNGIYAVGNTHTNGTGSLTGTVRYIGTGTSFTDNVGLTEGTPYWYKVYTVDKAFNYSDESQGTGTTSSSGTPSIAISTSHPASTDISQASFNNILASYQLDVTTATATLNSISLTTAGTYAAADIATNGFKLWINSANNLTGATQLGSSQAAVGTGGTVAVTGLSQSVPVGTRYILVTADIASGATASNTISLATTAFSNIVFASGTKTGTDPAAASNAMTIIACTPTNVTGLSLTPGNTQISVSWSNPSCLDEVMIVAKASSSISASPSGDGSAYTANLAFGSGTGFDGGHVVYKGSTSPQTITGLTNGTTYFVKVFTRRGTVWSSGVESSATPSISGYYWNGGNIAANPANGGTGTWGTANSWRQPSASGAQATWANGNNAIFEGTAGTITIDADRSATAYYFNTNGYELANSTTRSLTGPIILGNNVGLTFSPNVNIVTPASGTTNIGSISGSGTANITINSAQGSATNVAQRINLATASSSISVPINIVSAGGSGSGTVAGIVATLTGTSLTSSATVTNNTAIKTMIGATSGNDLTVNSVIGGSADLQFSAGPNGGAGTITLNAANTYTGATIFNAANSGVIRLGITNALPTSTNVTMANSSSNGGIFDLNGFDQTIASLTSGVGGGSIRNNGGVDATLTINGSSSPSPFGLPITDGTTNKVLLVIAGTGTTELTGACTYTGLTTVSGGTLRLNRAGGGTLPSTNNVTVNGGTLRIQTNQTLNDLTIESGGSVFVESGATLTINGTLTLTNGNLTLGNNNLIVSGSISGGSASSYIQTNGAGKLIRSVGTSPVTYPVGNSSYNPATLTRTTASNNFGVRVIDAVYDGGTGGTPITDDVVNRTWDVTLEGGSVNPLTIEVQWSTSDQGSGFNGSACYLSHYTGGGWQQTTEAMAGGSNPFTISRSGITSLSPFAVGSKGALPIELLSFEAKKSGAAVLLSWATASEQNNDYMAVERSSEGSRWEELGRVAGAGTTTQPQSYSFSDEKPLPGLNYYRLRQVDFDGRFEYHKTIAVDFKSETGGLHLFPSPAQERLNVALPAPAAQDSELWLLDAQGRVLQRMVIPQGGTQGAFEVAALPEGVYFVRMAMGDVRSFRFVR